MIENKSNNRNYSTYISFFAIIVGIVFAVLYLKSDDNKITAKHIEHRNNDTIRKLLTVLEEKNDSIRILKNKLLIVTKELYNIRKDTVIKSVKYSETDIETIFDNVFVDIACLVSKFMISKAGSDTTFINCNLSLSELIKLVDKYPSAKICITQAKKGNYVHGKNTNEDATAVNNYINSIIDYLRKLKIYSESEITGLQMSSLNILKNAQLELN